MDIYKIGFEIFTSQQHTFFPENTRPPRVLNLTIMGEQKYSYQLDNKVEKSLESTKYNKFILCIIGWVLCLFQEKKSFNEQV